MTIYLRCYYSSPTAAAQGTFAEKIPGEKLAERDRRKHDNILAL
jgi:hypothetical protein